MCIIKKLTAVVALSTTASFFGCKNKNINPVMTKVRKITYPAFGGVDLEITSNQLFNLGYEYGDLIMAKFIGVNEDGSDENIIFPFVTNPNEAGYFAPCLINWNDARTDDAHPDIGFGLNHLRANTKKLIDGNYRAAVELSMHAKGAFKKTRDALACPTKLTYEETGFDNLKYANSRDPAVSVGKIGKIMRNSVLYRGSSPFNYEGNEKRYEYVDNILGITGIEHEISLANSEKEISEYMKELKRRQQCYQTTSLWDKYLEKKDLPGAELPFCFVNLGSDYFTKLASEGQESGYDAMRKVIYYIATIFSNHADNPPAIYIHCNEGKDRTGFICMLLEALAGVSFDDIVADFMLTFTNYYNISYINNPSVYKEMVNQTIYRFVYSICVDNPGVTLEKINWPEFKEEIEEELFNHYKVKEGSFLQQRAILYLKNVLDITDETINTVKAGLIPALRS